MPSYLGESYLAPGRKGGRPAFERQTRLAADRATQGRTSVHFQYSIYVPEDDTCFFVFDAPSGSAAAAAVQRAELDPIRVVEAVTSGEAAP